MSNDPDAPPFNPLPWAVVVLAASIALIEIVFFDASKGLIGGPAGFGWRLAAIEAYGPLPAHFDYMVATGRWDVSGMIRFVTYPFLHFGVSHVPMVLVFLLALGRWSARRSDQLQS